MVFNVMRDSSGRDPFIEKIPCFFNELLNELESSKLCCVRWNVNSSLASYANDLATATTSKNRTDRVHEIVNEYGNRWRFKFNASKSAVLVFGEDRKTNGMNSKHRVFRLGRERVKEKEAYNHVGVKYF